MCSVLFVDIVGYSKKTNAEQLDMKQKFVSLWAKAIKDVPPDDIMVVDAGDGAALTALVEPEDTIRVAMALREATEENNRINTPLDIRMGINFGPVQLSVDVHGKACIVGDAINIAQRIMSFADPGQITIARSYYDVIKPLAHKYEGMFYYLGQRSDKHVRHHYIYGLGKQGGSAPLGNAVSEGIDSLRNDEQHEEIRRETSAKAPAEQSYTAQSMSPPRASEGFFMRLVNGIGSMISSVWNFFASIIRTILNFIWEFVRWLRFIVPVLVIAYELLVLIPVYDKPEAMKNELSSQVNAAAHFVKSTIGVKEPVAEAAAPASDTRPAGTTATAAKVKHRAAEHASTDAVQPDASQGK